MWYVEKITNPSPSTRLNIELGNHVLIKLPEMEATVKSALIGLEPQQYLIVRIPVGIDLTEQLSHQKKLSVSYVSLGTTYGFNAEVLGAMEFLEIADNAQVMFI